MDHVDRNVFLSPAVMEHISNIYIYIRHMRVQENWSTIEPQKSDEEMISVWIAAQHAWKNMAFHHITKNVSMPGLSVLDQELPMTADLWHGTTWGWIIWIFALFNLFNWKGNLAQTVLFLPKSSVFFFCDFEWSIRRLRLTTAGTVLVLLLLIEPWRCWRKAIIVAESFSFIQYDQHRHPTKGCFLEAFRYAKPTKKHSLGVLVVQLPCVFLWCVEDFLCEIDTVPQMLWDAELDLYATDYFVLLFVFSWFNMF